MIPKNTISTASPVAERLPRLVEFQSPTKSLADATLSGIIIGKGFFYRRFRNERQSPDPKLRRSVCRFVSRMEHGKSPKAKDVALLIRHGLITLRDAMPVRASILIA